MGDIVTISRWFYPANVSLLVWLTACAVLAVIARLVSPKITFLAGIAGGLICLGMIAVESITFELASPVCIAAYAVLLAVFVWLIFQSRSARPRIIQLATSFLLASAAFAYLFPFGTIPPMVELKGEALGNLEGINVLGGPGTLLVTEFADFECPPCAAQDQTMDKLWSAYPDKIRYSFRHLPLKKLHPNAEPAALESQCAAELGRFWETKRLLFANQHRLGDLLSQEALPTIAAGDAESYRECVQSRRRSSDVEKDIGQAERLGIRRTPSIVVGNKLITGMISYQRLEVIVRRELRSRSHGTQEAKHAKPACGSPLSTGCAE